MKRIAYLENNQNPCKIRVTNKKLGDHIMQTWNIPSRNWRYITERDWNSPTFRTDEDRGEITTNTPAEVE